MQSTLTQFLTARNNLGHTNNMPENVRTLGATVARSLKPVMNNCEAAGVLGVSEATVRRWTAPRS